MKKRVLVIGGSMFVGRVFSILASQTGEIELHVINRGKLPLDGLENVTEYKCDRHSARALGRIAPDLEYDALVDFCAYDEGEIAPLALSLAPRVKQYIYISTADVYDPSFREIKTENAPLLPDIAPDLSPDTAPDGVRGKLLLEKELVDAAGRLGMGFTILRPTFIYGPYNYNSRESWYVELIARNHIVPVPTDATASFSLVYVKDVANALIAMAGDKRAYNEIFNLAAPEKINCTRLISDFERYNGGAFETRELTVAEAAREYVPMPFPATEDYLISGEKFASAFDFKYTPLAEGMENTFKTFYSLFTS
ncbi:MAG: NAD-dependent epimerase/dehydratase family protein [Oscillospiraceae bacterium]|nr:NAD-dependent epimerase/dehydratase family protein [Oscillospiraceae bacterium]